MHCNGKCYLAKQLKNSETSTNIPIHYSNVFFPFVSIGTTFLYIYDITLSQINTYTTYINKTFYPPFIAYLSQPPNFIV